MSTRNVTGVINDPATGAPWVGVDVKFVLDTTGLTLAPPGIYPPRSITVTTIAGGVLGAAGVGIPLWANEEGETLTKWYCTIDRKFTFSFTLPPGATPIDLSVLKAEGLTSLPPEDSLIAIIDARIAAVGGGGGVWGDITGTLSAQTDLQAALDAKANSLGADDNYATDAEKVKLANLSGTNTGDQDISGKANLVSPAFTTPSLGVASATSLSVSGNITVTGSSFINSSTDVVIRAATSLYLQTGVGSGIGIRINNAGHLAAYPSDNAYDIGTSGANRFRNIFVGSSVVIKTKAGAPTDSDVTNPADGMSVLDTTNHRLYFRSGGVWKFTQLT